MNLKKAAFIFYTLVVMLLLGYSAFYEFHDWSFGDFIEMDITAANIHSNTIKGGIVYIILDNENKTYFFTTTESSKILNDLDVMFGKSNVRIKYNVRNNEISEVGNGFETERRKFFNWKGIVIWLAVLALALSIGFLKAVISDKWLSKLNRSNRM